MNETVPTKKLPVELERTESTMEFLNSLGPLFEQYNRQHPLSDDQSEANVLHMLEIGTNHFCRMAEGCRTMGDLRQKLLARYADFDVQIRALETEPPSIERFEKVCDTIQKAILVSISFQDASVLSVPAAARAYDLLCVRPKSPQGAALKPFDFHFSEEEVARILAALKKVAEHLLALKGEAGVISFLKTDIKLPEPFAFLMDIPKEERAKAVFFDRQEDGSYRYRSELLIFLKPSITANTRIFQNEDSKFDNLNLDFLRNLPQNDAARNMVTAMIPNIKKSALLQS